MLLSLANLVDAVASMLFGAFPMLTSTEPSHPLALSAELELSLVSMSRSLTSDTMP